MTLAKRTAAEFFAGALAAAWLTFTADPACAGPPFQTDDPEPVDLHHYEFYIATQQTLTSDGRSGTCPSAFAATQAGTAGSFEFNYGAAKDVQLHLIAPVAFSDPSGGTHATGAPVAPGSSCCWQGRAAKTEGRSRPLGAVRRSPSISAPAQRLVSACQRECLRMTIANRYDVFGPSTPLHGFCRRGCRRSSLGRASTTAEESVPNRLIGASAPRPSFEGGFGVLRRACGTRLCGRQEADRRASRRRGPSRAVAPVSSRTSRSQA